MFQAVIFRQFGGGRLTKLSDLSKASKLPDALFLFEELVMGGADLCQRCINTLYELPGGRELDGTRLFRVRMYRMFNHLPPRPRRSFMERRAANATLKAILIHNKRFSPRELEEIQALVAQANNDTRLNVNLQFVDYRAMPAGPRFGANAGLLAEEHLDLETHLKLLASVDIHISGPGTAQMYVPFLPDGSVAVSVGQVRCRQAGAGKFECLSVSHMEQYLAGGCPYLRAIYYPRAERVRGVKEAGLRALVEEAAALIRSDFAIPADSGEAGSGEANLAGDARLFREMCARDPVFRRMTTNRSGGWSSCNSFWVEDWLMGIKGWTASRECDHGYNKTQLAELKAKHGFEHLL